VSIGQTVGRWTREQRVLAPQQAGEQERKRDAALTLFKLPLLATACVAGVGLAGWVYLPAWWLASAVPGVLIAFPVWRWAPPGPERSLALPVTALASITLGVTWWMGPDLPSGAAWLLLALSYSALWLAYGRLIDQERDAEPAVDADALPESTVDPLEVGAHEEVTMTRFVVGPEPTARELLAPALEDWPSHAASVGLAGLAAEVASETPDVLHLLLRMSPTMTLRFVGSRLDQLEVALARSLEPFRLRPGALRIERDPMMAHAVHLYVEVRDPLARAITYPGRSADRFAEPALVAYYGDGSPMPLHLDDRHLMVAGKTGSGKSMLLALLALELARPDTVTFAIDVTKAGDSYAAVEPVLAGLARTPQEAIDMVEGLHRLRLDRQRRMAAAPLLDRHPSPGFPQVVLIVDEVTSLVPVLGGVEPLLALVREARSARITVVLGTQRVTADALGESIGLRTECDRIMLRVDEKRSSAAFFGDDLVAEGWRPDLLNPGVKGLLLAWSKESQLPRPARTYDLPVELAVQLAAQEAHSRPQLPDEDQEAMAPRSRRLRPAQPQLGAFTDVLPTDWRSEEPEPALTQRAGDVLRKMLADAGPEGCRAADLVDAAGRLPVPHRRQRASVYLWLRGNAEDAGHGRWRLRSRGEEQPCS
jgi:hypothetical protein